MAHTGWEVRLLALVGLISTRGWIDAGKATSQPLRKKQLQHSPATQQLCDLRQLTVPSGFSFKCAKEKDSCYHLLNTSHEAGTLVYPHFAGGDTEVQRGEVT